MWAVGSLPSGPASGTQPGKLAVYSKPIMLLKEFKACTFVDVCTVSLAPAATNHTPPQRPGAPAAARAPAPAAASPPAAPPSLVLALTSDAVLVQLRTGPGGAPGGAAAGGGGARTVERSLSLHAKAGYALAASPAWLDPDAAPRAHDAASPYLRRHGAATAAAGGGGVATCLVAACCSAGVVRLVDGASLTVRASLPRPSPTASAARRCGALRDSVTGGGAAAAGGASQPGTDGGAHDGAAAVDLFPDAVAASFSGGGAPAGGGGEAALGGRLTLAVCYSDCTLLLWDVHDLSQVRRPSEGKHLEARKVPSRSTALRFSGHLLTLCCLAPRRLCVSVASWRTAAPSGAWACCTCPPRLHLKLCPTRLPPPSCTAAAAAWW